MEDIFSAAGTVVEDNKDIFASAGTVVEDNEDIFAATGTVVDKESTFSEDVQGAGQKLLDGLTFGFGDELAAGLRVGTDELVRMFDEDLVPTGSAKQRYERYLNQGRTTEEKFSKDNPILSTALEIGAAITTGVGTARLAGTAATRLGNVGRQGLVSAADVTVYQIGEAEGALPERVSQVDPVATAIGATIGGIAGAFLKGAAEVPTTAEIKNRASTNIRKSFSASNVGVQRGEMAIGEGVQESKLSRSLSALKGGEESLILRVKDWAAKNINDRAAMNIVNSDGQGMQVIGRTMQALDTAGGAKGSIAKLDKWFEETAAGQQAKKYLADAGKTGKYGVVDNPETRQKNFNIAMGFLRDAPEDVRKTFDALNSQMRALKDLDPGNKATGDFWPMRLKTGASEATITGNYLSPAASAISYLEDVRVAQILAKNFDVSPTATQGLKNVNQLRQIALNLEKRGKSEKFITNVIQKQLARNGESNTDRVIDAIIKKSDDLSPEQAANLKEILTTTFIAGRTSASEFTNALRVAVSTSQLARLSGTILNLSEVGVAATNFGIVNALKSLPQAIRSALTTNGDMIIDDFGNSLRLADLGIVNQFMGEIKQGTGVVDKYADKLFTISGVKAINRLGQETALNAALKQAQALAKRGKLSELKAAKGMTPSELEALSTQLTKGNIRHPDVKDFVFRQLTDVAPVSRTSMPKFYNDHPEGRVFYSMLSFMVQQHNLLRENVGANIVNAYRKGMNTKEGQKHFKDALDYGLRYTVLTAGLAGFFDDGRKMLRGDEGIEYDPVSSTANQLAQFATLGVVQPRAEQWGGKPVSLLNPPQFSMLEDVGGAAYKTVTGEAEYEDIAKVMQRWLPGVSNLDDFIRYFNDGERLLTD